MVKSYDVVVVGSGSGGQTAAYTLMEYGLSVAGVENSATPGGICALAGCQAKKWFYAATETMARARHLAVLVGTRKALAMAVKNQDTSRRQTLLKELLQP